MTLTFDVHMSNWFVLLFGGKTSRRMAYGAFYTEELLELGVRNPLWKAAETYAPESERERGLVAGSWSLELAKLVLDAWMLGCLENTTLGGYLRSTGV